MKRIIGYFLQGLLYLGPIAVTIYLIVQVFNFIDGLLRDYIEYVFGITIPGLGLAIILIILTVLGYLGQTILASPFKRILKKLILKIPPVNLIYSSLSDFFAAIVGKERKFNRPVLVRIHDNSELSRIGFITEDELDRYGMVDKAAVYFPFSYAISGELLIVPRKNITELNIPASVAMKFILSGGVTDIEPGY
ncbi:MAG: DUF502 domain-containing protein [Cyclobacteriaceae bacterium]|nr:DUF502 domain-containing protein [Cyclobacteriaceae bacterium]